MPKIIVIPGNEYYDEVNNRFFTTKEQRIKIEHSLVSLSKWEGIYKVPFMSSEKTVDQWKKYVECMTISQNIDPQVYEFMPISVLNEAISYINDSQTATTIYKNEDDGKVRHGKPKQKIITAEFIYYWMFSYGIPIECQKWHLSKLLMLIEVFSVENSKSSNKMSSKDIARQNRAIIEARRKAHNSKG